MASYKSFAPEVEVIGEVIAAFVAGFPTVAKGEGLVILTKHGINQPQLGQFYPLQALLDAMQEVADRMGDQMLYRIGAEIAKNAKLPPDIDNLEVALGAIDTAYHMNQRGGEIGHYRFVDEGTSGGLRIGRMECLNPYPHAFDRGVLDGFAERFRPEDCIDVVIRDDESAPNRKAGARASMYIVTWC